MTPANIESKLVFVKIFGEWHIGRYLGKKGNEKHFVNVRGKRFVVADEDIKWRTQCSD